MKKKLILLLTLVMMLMPLTVSAKTIKLTPKSYKTQWFSSTTILKNNTAIKTGTYKIKVTNKKCMRTYMDGEIGQDNISLRTFNNKVNTALPMFLMFKAPKTKTYTIKLSNLVFNKKTSYIKGNLDTGSCSIMLYKVKGNYFSQLDHNSYTAVTKNHNLFGYNLKKQVSFKYKAKKGEKIYLNVTPYACKSFVISIK